MIIFICSSSEQESFDKAIDKISKFTFQKMNILYLSFGLDNETRNKKYSEFIKHLGSLPYGIVDTPENAAELVNRNINEYSLIVIESGNPFKIMSELSNYKDALLKAIGDNTPLLAIGGGAVVLGNNLEQSEINHNHYDLDTDIQGLNLFDGQDIFIYSDKYTTNTYFDESEKLKFASEKKNRNILALQQNTVIYKVSKGVYKLNGRESFDIIIKGKIYRCPFEGKIKYDLTFNK